MYLLFIIFIVSIFMSVLMLLQQKTVKTHITPWNNNFKEISEILKSLKDDEI